MTNRMVLPQTNLQLYQCLVQGDASAAELGQVRAAYDAAQTLFCDCVRPSHKPFLCHLVGTAGALALWQQDLPVVIAGLLHSAYLFGQFGDGDRGPSGRRRRWLRSIVGSDVENLVWRYSTLRWDQPIAAVRRLALADATYRDLVAVKFADEFEELSDGSPKYSLKKSYVFGMGSGEQWDDRIMDTLAEAVHDNAAGQFRAACQRNQELDVPESLRTEDQCFHVVRTGVESLRRNRIRQRVLKWSRKLRRSA
ncbi:MAG: hypothetical protein VX346_03600 [Planctomycetota bacterium]|nr:hypothetical protein [Planctomycetota bacterium]